MQRQDAGSAQRGAAGGVVKSAGRVLEILEYFDRVRTPANVGMVAAALGYPQSSTSALMRSLVATGYLRHDPRARTYTPTERVPLLGSWIAPRLFEGAPLLRLIEAVRSGSGLAVFLAARTGDHAQILHVTGGEAAGLSTGQRLPLAASAPGQVLLAAMAENEAKRLVHRLNAEAADPAHVVRLPDLAERLALVRRSGRAIAALHGLGMLAQRLPADCAERPLALCVAGTESLIAARAAELATLLRGEITRLLARPAMVAAPAVAVPAAVTQPVATPAVALMERRLRPPPASQPALRAGFG